MMMILILLNTNTNTDTDTNADTYTSSNNNDQSPNLFPADDELGTCGISPVSPKQPVLRISVRSTITFMQHD